MSQLPDALICQKPLNLSSLSLVPLPPHNILAVKKYVFDSQLGKFLRVCVCAVFFVCGKHTLEVGNMN
jgi:hypothetical protein